MLATDKSVEKLSSEHRCDLVELLSLLVCDGGCATARVERVATFELEVVS